MAFCSNCGNNVNEGAVFCAQCGKQILQNSNSSKASYSSLNSKPSSSLQPNFSGSKSNIVRIVKHYAPEDFEPKKEEFKKIVKNLVVALNSMNQGAFSLEEINEWGNKSKFNYMQIFRNDGYPILKVTSEFHKENLLRFADYKVTSNGVKELKNTSLLPETVKKEVEALEKLFDGIPAMIEI